MTWYQWQEKDLILRLRLQPKASKDEFIGEYGETYKVRITAPPVEGKANKHLITFLAKEFKVTKKAIIIEAGETGRNKRIRIKNPQKIPSQLEID